MVIVLTAFVAVGVYWNRDQLAIHIKSVFVRVPPKASQKEPPSKRDSSAFVADAGWALSALPECFLQEEKVTGPREYVFRHLPMSQTEIKAPSVLRVADCTIRLRSDGLLVERGEDRLHVPGPVWVFAPMSSFDMLYVIRQTGGGFEERVYRAQGRLDETS